MADPDRFSLSPVWRLQKDYYRQLGVETWARAMVPFNATSNAFIASRYARAIATFARDVVAHQGRGAELNIVELGAGHGRFSYMLLRALEACGAERCGVRLRYVMIDLAERNVGFWQQHPQLADDLAQGRLCFSTFDAETPATATIAGSGQPLADLLRGKALIIIANFVLDVLPYDLFRVRGAAVEACQVDWVRPPGLDLNAPPGDVIAQSSLVPRFVAAATPYYPDAADEALLRSHAAGLREAVFPLPVTALRALRHFDALSRESLWLISEEGESELAALEGNTRTGLKKAGSFTARVNLHALFADAQARDGLPVLPAGADARFDTYAILGAGSSHWPATRRAVDELLQHFRPKDYYRLISGLADTAASPDVDAMSALLALGEGDPYLITRLRTSLAEACAAARGARRAQLAKLLAAAWPYYFDLGESRAFAEQLGRLLYSLRATHAAAYFFEQAALRAPQDHRPHYWLGRCATRLQETAAAGAHYRKALACRPGHAGSKRRLKRLEEQNAG